MAAVAGFVTGGFLAMALLALATSFTGVCPDFDDEGPMAAPDSLYTNLMCPVETFPAPIVLMPAGSLGLLAALVPVGLVRRGRRPGSSPANGRTIAIWLVGALVMQPLVVLVAQYTLPRDCLSGRTPTGECSRERELR